VLRKVRKAIGHPVTQNVIALGWMQLATFIVPLITLPYVARVLRPSAFGLVVFAQGFSMVLVVFIDWGFGYTGIRSTAEHQGDHEGLSAAVHRVRGAQSMLALASLPIALLALVFVPKMNQHPEFLVMAWVAAVATALAPGWFFVGTERMRKITLIQLLFRGIGAALTLILVKRPDQAWIVMALFTASAVAGWIASDVMMYRRIPFQVPALRPSVRELRGATVIFLGTIAGTLYTSFNVVLLGLFESSASVAHFGAAERVVRVSLTVMGPIGLAVLPRMTALQSQGHRERARRLLMIAVVGAGSITLVLTAGLFVFAPTVIRILYGHRFLHDSVPILRVLVLIIPISIVGVIFGSWLMTLHQDRLIAIIVLRAGILNVILGCILTPLLGPIGMAWSVIVAETTAAIGGVITVRRNSRRERAAAASAPRPDEPDPVVLVEQLADAEARIG
jgi:polysaccharide transporter, PST family